MAGPAPFAAAEALNPQRSAQRWRRTHPQDGRTCLEGPKISWAQQKVTTTVLAAGAAKCGAPARGRTLRRR